MSKIPELDKPLEKLRESLVVPDDNNRQSLREAFGYFQDQEFKGQVIYQNPSESVMVRHESAPQLERFIVYWDLKNPQRASKYGQVPADYLLVFPIRKAEVNDDELHPLLNKMKGRMHRICAVKLGFDHAVSFTPTCFYPKEEALLVKVEHEENIIFYNNK